MDWKNKIDPVANKVKFQLHATKQDDLERIMAICNKWDPQGTGCLCKVSFSKFLADCGVFLTSQELREVYNKYEDQDGIHYQSFLQFVRTSFSDQRLKAVKAAFCFLDKTSCGKISLEQLMSCYQPANHPRVLIRDKNCEEVFAGFKAAVCKKSSDGQCLTEAEFLEYYADVNATLPNEKESYFCDLVQKTWGVTSGGNYVSQERISALRTTIYEKVRQKTNPGQDEGETIKKAFKYFDLDNSGRVNIKQFWQAMDKFGCVFQQSEIEAIFNFYDQDNSGTMSIQEFANMCATMGSGTNPNVNPVFSLKQQEPTEVIAKIQKCLMSRQTHGIHGLWRSFCRSDKNSAGYLTRHEFTWTLKDNGHALTKTELDKLFCYFDRNGKDCVDYSEFMKHLQADLPQSICDILSGIWQKHGPSLQGLCDAYSVANHPRLLSGKNSEVELRKEFLQQFDFCSKAGQVSCDEFQCYYRNVFGFQQKRGKEAVDSFLNNCWGEGTCVRQ